jgi:hypothetical protein
MIEHGEHGSRTAGPIAKKVIQTYLGIPDEDEAVETGAEVPEVD